MVSSKRASSVQSRSNIIRHTEHGDFKKGSPVRIAGERGKWEFLYHCVNADTGSEWIDVFGGEPGAETLRAFKEDRVILIRPKGYRAPRAPKPEPELTLEDLL